ncbi:MAG: hypothetical protein Q9185_001111 [Variospora sp. 1 TL-2023]
MAPEFPNPSIDEADDLFDYDIDMQEAFRDANVAMSVSNLEPTGLSKSKDVDLGLGIDEEIKVTKKRRPVPKLDENRLRVSLFWLDDLYPRAKFADGLAMIEKLGHSKKIQDMRRAWIKEERPHEKPDREDTAEDNRWLTSAMGQEGKHDAAASENQSSMGHNLGLGSPTHEDLYRESPSQHRDSTSHQSTIGSRKIPSSPHTGNQGDLSDDDLDALLAETYTGSNGLHSFKSASRSPQSTLLSRKVDDIDAELEVTAQMDEVS